MIKGLGIDLVKIGEATRLMKQFGSSPIDNTFTPNDVSVSRRAPVPAAYMVACFAVKEAVFKVVRPPDQKEDL